MQLFPQSIQNQLLVWALVNALITLVLSFVLRGGKPAFTTAGLARRGIAAATIAVGYLSLVARRCGVQGRLPLLGAGPEAAGRAATR